jgi:thiol:disulfide interchange protein DsbA
MHRIWTAFFLLVFSISTWAQNAQVMDPENEPYKAGKDYIVLPESYAQHTTAQASLLSHPDKIEILSFFNYGCPVCYRMEPAVEEWHRQQKEMQIISFTDVPVVWDHPGWENLARAFYIAEALGVLQTAHTRLFRAVHQQNKKFITREELEEFFITELGVTRDQFNENYDSFTTRRKLKQAELLRNAYKIRSIPSFVIAGKYMVDMKTSGGVDRAVEIVNFLVNKESFAEGADELKFDDVSQGIDHSDDDVYELGDEQNNREDLGPSTAPQ